MAEERKTARSKEWLEKAMSEAETRKMADVGMRGSGSTVPFEEWRAAEEREEAQEKGLGMEGGTSHATSGQRRNWR
jgi:hypothetical protein